VIQDGVDAASDGDTVLVTNGVYTTGGKAVYGTMTNRVAVDKPVSLLSVNGSEVTIIEGYQVPGTTNGDGAIRCAYLTNGASLAGFTLTGGATRDLFVVWDPPTYPESSGGGVWCQSTNALVTNCVLTANSASHGGGASGGRLAGCVISSNSATAIGFGLGGGAYGSHLTQCELRHNHADSAGGAVALSTLSNCTLTNSSAFFGGGARESTLDNCALLSNSANEGGAADSCVLNDCRLAGNSGSAAANGSTLIDCLLISNLNGGAFDCTLSNCSLIGNSSTGPGGGAEQCALENCLLVGNSATGSVSYGGGAHAGSLVNCTVVGNSSDQRGGGVSEADLTNCIVYFNSAPLSPNYDLSFGGSLGSTCTTPLPPAGVGNITNAPLFVDTDGWNDPRLQSNSPCINAGNNAYVSTSTDLDGNPRIIGGTVDMGAYEYTYGSTINGVPWAWLLHYGLPTDGSADYLDSDMDGHNAWQEWKAWTDPTNALSVLRMLTPQPQTNGTVLTWQSVDGHSYLLERATNADGIFSLLQANLPGQADTTSFTDTNMADSEVILYRVGVSE